MQLCTGDQQLLALSSSRGGFGSQTTGFRKHKHRICCEILLRDTVDSEQVDQQAIQSEISSYAFQLRRCTKNRSLFEGKCVHEQIICNGYKGITLLANLLIEMYGSCERPDDAFKVFDGLAVRNVFSWTIMIAAFAQNGHYREALQHFEQMHLEGVKPNKFTLSSILTVCSNLGALAVGQKIHACIESSEFVSDTYVSNALINLYGKCGSLGDARGIFDTMEGRDVVSWSAMIAAYSQCGHGEAALKLFQEMDLEGVEAASITFISLVDACASTAALSQGTMLHARVVAKGFDSEVHVGNSLVHMYGKCGETRLARTVFDGMQEKDVVSWTAMISAYAERELQVEAFRLLRDMDLEGIKPNRITIATLLEACLSQEAQIRHGEELHARAARDGLDSGGLVATALINMYGNSRSIEAACGAFARLEKRDLIHWTAMIGAYVASCCHEEALGLLRRMDVEGVKPNTVTFVNLINACASLADLAQGKVIHGRTIDEGIVLELHVCTALVNMYGKGGSVNEARSLFDEMAERDAVLWSAMITAYSQHGYAKESLQLFQQMQLDSVTPNEITFANILCACSHAGLIKEAFSCFACIQLDYCMSPTAEHYVSLIDLLGRAGHLYEAEQLIDWVPFEHRDSVAVAWTSLLGACSVHGDEQRGTHAAKEIHILGAGN